MELITILNRCHHFRGLSRCHLPAPGYDQFAERRFVFIPLWGFLVFLLYTMWRAVEHLDTERSARSTLSASMKFSTPKGTTTSPWSTD